MNIFEKCKGCTKRYYDPITNKTCHATCDYYLNAKKQMNKIHDLEKTEQIFSGYKADVDYRIYKRYKYNKYNKY